VAETDERSLGRLVGANVLTSALAKGWDALLILVSVPIVVGALGAERYGLLSLAVILTNFLVLLDPGISQALLAFLPDAAARGDRSTIRRLVGTGLLLVGIASVAGAALMAAAAAWVPGLLDSIPEALKREAMIVLLWTAATVAVTLPQRLLSAVSLSYQRLNRVNALTGVVNTLRYGALVWLMSQGYGVATAAAVHAGAGLLQLVGQLGLVAALAGPAALRPRWDREAVPQLARYGGAATASSVASALAQHLEKLTLGWLQPVGLLPFYQIPFNLAARIWELPGMVMGPTSAAFARLHAAGERERLAGGYVKVSRFVLIGATHLCVLAVLFAPDLLRLWVGPEFEQRSTPVLRLLAAGMFLSVATTTPMSLALAIRRPDIPARVHAGLLVLTAALCAWLIPRFGILGAAMTWTAVHFVDFFWMTIWVHRAAGVISTARYAASVFPRPFVLSVGVGALALLARPLATNLAWLLAILAVAGALYLAAAYALALSTQERTAVRNALADLFVPKNP
jgi:O-antigen/teichoic acid export membrane protein